MKTANVIEFDKDLFKVEELYERAGIIVETFNGVEPYLVSDEEIESYILELRNYLAESELSPSHIFLRPDGKIELLFYPINARGFTEDELNTLAYELDIVFTFYNKLKVEIPENIISDYKPELTQAEMYYLFVTGVEKNTKDFKNNILGEIPTPNDKQAIEIKAAQ
ncbi:hypothetical protein [Halanaerobium sp. ST460_2HS_T2]|uniref:hypothetical protein n=1 Tax=Halanaerobium sp. ST460_2HS_T2 TaxID=2183914 RepID=UPI000DF4431C|nr:hypothetical protein [Halanaerobium sp. ST460_2HS_T2]RCW60968.1 hypothetical protein DFR80_106127 [Halanaerobium sp. ST460_2HS_T2]